MRDTAIAYSSTEVCELVGCTYRQLDYWVRKGYVQASVQDACGSGSRRRFSTGDVHRIKVMYARYCEAQEVLNSFSSGDMWRESA